MRHPICIALLLFSCFNAIAQNPLTDSLIAYYPFSGNANDASGNGNNGTVYGATLTTDRYSNPNSAYLFNGTSDFISYKSVSKFEPSTTPVSITFWFKPNVPSYGTLFANNYTWGIYTGFSVDMEPTGGTIEANIFDNGPTNPPNRRSIGSSINLFDNKWHFAAAIISGPLDMAIFIDCNYDSATTYDGSGGPLAYVGDTGISGRSFLLPAGYQYSLYYSGALDEIRFYHRALTKNDLILIHNYPDSTLLTVSPLDTTICSGDSVSLKVSGGTNYSWSPSSGLNNTNTSNPIAKPLVTTTYTITVGIDSFVCGTTIDSVILSVNSTLPITSGPGVSICKNDTTQLSITGKGPYSWSPSTGLNNSTSANPTASPIVTTTYTVTAFNSCGTKSTDSTVVTVLPPLLINISFPDTSICLGASASISVGRYNSYSWSPLSGLNCSTCQSPMASPVVSTTYTVTVENSTGCYADTTITINLLPAPQIDLSASIVVPCNSGVLLSPIITGDSSFHWLNAAGLTDTTSLTQMVTPLQTTNYTIVATNRTCETSATIMANIEDAFVIVPNAFSPNGDGLNDYFKPIYVCGFELIIFRIYNRWGQEVFETNSPTGQWDGNFNGARSPVGSYAYYVEGTKDNGDRLLLKGNVTLLR